MMAWGRPCGAWWPGGAEQVDPPHATYACGALLTPKSVPTLTSAGVITSQRRPTMGNPSAALAVIVTVVIVVVLLATSLRIANEYERAVVFRLGRFVATRGPGLYFLIPMIERQVTIDLRVVTADVEEQDAITK